jgi:hypothetical protein
MNEDRAGSKTVIANSRPRPGRITKEFVKKRQNCLLGASPLPVTVTHRYSQQRGESMKRLSLGTWLFFLLLTGVTFAADGAGPDTKLLHQLTVHLLDGNGKPVSGAHVGVQSYFWKQRLKPAKADNAGFMYQDHCLSDAQGVARIESQDDFSRARRPIGIVARHEGRGLVALTTVDRAQLKGPIEIRLSPECRVSGKLVCPEWH